MKRSQRRRSSVMSMKPLPGVVTRSMWLAWLRSAMVQARRERCRLTAPAPSRPASRSCTISCKRRIMALTKSVISSRAWSGNLAYGPAGPGSLPGAASASFSSALASLSRSSRFSSGEAIDLRFERQTIVGDALAGPMVELRPADRHRARSAVEPPDAVADGGHGVAARRLDGESARSGGRQNDCKSDELCGHGVVLPAAWSSCRGRLASPRDSRRNVPQQGAA